MSCDRVLEIFQDVCGMRRSGSAVVSLCHTGLKLPSTGNRRLYLAAPTKRREASYSALSAHLTTPPSMRLQQTPLSTCQWQAGIFTAHRRGPRPFQRSTACKAYCNERPGPEQAGKVAAAACLSALLCAPGPVYAREKIAEFQASGFLFKDTVEVNALDDPAVPGVTIYFSDFKRSLVDKLQKDFFAEPSQASLTCSIAPDAVITDPSNLGGLEGKEVFSEKKGLSIFKDKTLRVRRVYDPTRRTLLYVAYSTRLSNAADEGNVSSGRYRTSICALRLPTATAPAVEATAAAVSATP